MAHGLSRHLKIPLHTIRYGEVYLVSPKDCFVYLGVFTQCLVVAIDVTYLSKPGLDVDES